MSQLFDLTASDLFQSAQVDANNLDALLDESNDPATLIAAIQLAWKAYHLREWICPENSRLKNGDAPETAEERFFVAIHENCPEFKVLRKIANRTKHVRSQESINAVQFSGFFADISRAGQSLGRHHIFVDGFDLLWEIIVPVLLYYRQNWFDDRTR